MRGNAADQPNSSAEVNPRAASAVNANESGDPGHGNPLGRRITMSNVLVALPHGLTLYQKRIVMLAVGKLNSRDQIGFTDQVVSAREYADLCSIDLRTAYKEITEAAQTLARSAVRTRNPHTGKPVDIPWLKKAEYNSGSVALRFNDQMADGLLQLKTLFTSYRLANVARLRSAHAWRLYELLVRYRKSGRARYPAGELADALSLTVPQRANFAEARRSIIEPATRSVSKATDIQVTEIATERAGRRIVAVTFQFRATHPLG